MRAVIQRVKSATCRVDGDTTGAIGPGLLVFLGITDDDNDEDLQWLIQKIPNIRIFPDKDQRMNLSVSDLDDGGILVISQFTLFGSLKKGTRPSFNRAGSPDYAEKQYSEFLRQLSSGYSGAVAAGRFGADMQIEAHNDGPVTLILDSKERSF